MAFPAAIPGRRLYDTAKRVRDELGKGQEVLRTKTVQLGPPADGGGVVTAFVMTPEVDIRIVEVKMIGEAHANWDIELLAPAATDTAAGAANQLMDVVDASGTALADDIVTFGTLTALASRVAAGQPVLARGTDDTAGAPAGYAFIEVSYIPAEDVVGNKIRTYGGY